MTQDDKEYLSLLIAPLNLKLDGINDRLDKINGRVNKHDEMLFKLNEDRVLTGQKLNIYGKEQDELFEKVSVMDIAEKQHIANCPIAPKVRNLEDQMLTNRTVKKIMWILFTTGIALGGLVVGIIKLISD